MNLTLKVWRQSGPDDRGRMVTYQVEDVSPDMSFLEMLDVLNERLILDGADPVAFDSDCREGICGMCGLMINGEHDRVVLVGDIWQTDHDLFFGPAAAARQLHRARRRLPRLTRALDRLDYVHGNHDFVARDQLGAAGELRNRPRLRANASAAFALAPRCTASLFAAWTGRVFDSSIPTGNVRLAPYLVVDAAIGYVRGAARFTFAIDNVLDRGYQQFIGFPGQGRRARIEIAFDI